MRDAFTAVHKMLAKLEIKKKKKQKISIFFRCSFLRRISFECEINLEHFLWHGILLLTLTLSVSFSIYFSLFLFRFLLFQNKNQCKNKKKLVAFVVICHLSIRLFPPFSSSLMRTSILKKKIQCNFNCFFRFKKTIFSFGPKYIVGEELQCDTI